MDKTVVRAEIKFNAHVRCPAFHLYRSSLNLTPELTLPNNSFQSHGLFALYLLNFCSPSCFRTPLDFKPLFWAKFYPLWPDPVPYSGSKKLCEGLTWERVGAGEASAAHRGSLILARSMLACLRMAWIETQSTDPIKPKYLSSLTKTTILKCFPCCRLSWLSQLSHEFEFKLKRNLLNATHNSCSMHQQVTYFGSCELIKINLILGRGCNTAVEYMALLSWAEGFES